MKYYTSKHRNYLQTNPSPSFIIRQFIVFGFKTFHKPEKIQSPKSEGIISLEKQRTF
jgi:hypothetical protein